MKKGQELKFIDLFAGIGGIRLGIQPLGGECVFSSEFDKDACQTYNHNFKEIPSGDITKISEKDIPDHNFLLAGFPCQAFSIAGYRKGFNDEKGRGNLFFDIARILNEKRPNYILLENVKNLENHDNGKTFSVIIKTLNELGYYVKYKVLNTMEYANIPQNRERIYIVGFLDKNIYDNFTFPQPIPLTQTIWDIIDREKKQADKFYYNKSKYIEILEKEMINPNTIYQWRRVYVRENKNNVCPTLTANMGTGGHNVPLIRDSWGIRKLTPEECLKFQGFPDNYVFPDSISISAKYKQAGNSVSVPVVKRIAQNIKTAIENVL